MPKNPQEAPHARGLRRGGALTIVGAATQQASQLLVIWLVSRALGSTALGSYILAWAVLQVLGIVCMFGFRAALTRFIAMSLADQDDATLVAVVRTALAIGAGTAVVAGATVVACADPLARQLGDAPLAPGLVLIGCTLPALTLRELALAATQGWHTQRPFTLIGWVYEPLCRMLLTALALALGLGLGGAYGAVVISGWSSAILAIIALWRRLPRKPEGERRPGALRSLASFSSVSWLTTIASTGLIWTDTLLLGALATTDDVGQYTVATRVVSLAVFVMPPINALFTPRFAHQHHVGDLRGLGAAYRQSTAWILMLSMPAFVGLITVPGSILDVFGPGYSDAVWITLALVVGQLVNAATGPCGTIHMAGKVSLNMYANLANLALNIALNVWLIPILGALGSALAWTSSLVLVNLFRLISVRRVTLAYPFDQQTTRLMIVAAITTAAATVPATLLSAEPLRLIVVAVVIGLVYPIALLALMPRLVSTLRQGVNVVLRRRPASRAQS